MATQQPSQFVLQFCKQTTTRFCAFCNKFLTMTMNVVLLMLIVCFLCFVCLAEGKVKRTRLASLTKDPVTVIPSSSMAPLPTPEQIAAAAARAKAKEEADRKAALKADNEVKPVSGVVAGSDEDVSFGAYASSGYNEDG